MNELFALVKENAETVRIEIEKAVDASGRQLSEVSLMAVTKTHPVSYMKASLNAEIFHLGENRITEGGRKIKELGSEGEKAIFHAIGVLHRKEVRQAARDFDRLDAIHNMKIIEELGRRKTENEILLEINTSGEVTKQGFISDLVVLEESLGRAIDLGLNVKGLLTVGPLNKEEVDQRKAFSLLRETRNELEKRLGILLPVLSMGMSDDFVLAILEGSTIVRLGRRLFGRRK